MKGKSFVHTTGFKKNFNPKILVTLFVMIGFNIFGLFECYAQHTLVYTYENDTSGSVPYLNNCDVTPSSMNSSNAIVRSFVVTDSFTITDGGQIGLGINIAHNDRRELVLRLIAPNGATATLINEAGSNGSSNYDVMLTDLSESTAFNDGDGDNTGIPYYHRDIQSLGGNAFDAFIGTPTKGIWRILISDDESSTNGTFNRAKLVLRDSGGFVQSPSGSMVFYEWGSNGNNNAFVGTVLSGVTFSQISTNDVFGNGRSGSFDTKTNMFGSHVGYYYMSFDVRSSTSPDGDQNESGAMSTIFGFSSPVYSLSFGLLDNDYSTSSSFSRFEDISRVIAYDVNGNTVPYETWPQVPGTTAMDFVGDVWEGDVTIGGTDSQANAYYYFEGGVSRIEIEYFCGDAPTTPGVQYLGLSDLTFYDPLLLPIRLVEFTANNVDNHVQLNWNTSSESNSDYFHIERAGPEYEFSLIGNTKAAGNSNEPVSYGFKDDNPLPGLSYYRLKQVDFNGEINYSPVRSVDRREGIEKLEVSPNPSSGLVSVTTGVPAIEISVWSLMGENVMEYIPVNKQVDYELDISHLKSGIYYMRISYQNGQNNVVKLVRE